MGNKTLLERFIDSVNSRKSEIVELQNMYLLKQFEKEIVQERFKEVCNKVLAENCFYSRRNRNWRGSKIYKGDRILSSDDQFDMGEKDYDRFLDLCEKENYAAGLTDIEGRFTKVTNTENHLMDIKEKLIRVYQWKFYLMISSTKRC